MKERLQVNFEGHRSTMNKICRNFVALLVMLALIPLAVLVELFEGDRCPTMEWIDDVAARWDEWANKE